MSTIKISELATGTVTLESLLAFADANGIAFKGSVDELNDLISTLAVSGMKGAISTTDATPLEDGLYPCSESGTYTNFGGLIIDLSSTLSFISVSEAQTVFAKVEIPIDITLNSLQSIIEDGVISGSQKLTKSGDVYTHLSNSFKDIFQRDSTDLGTNTTGGVYNNESSTFSGWGCAIGNKVDFNAVSFKIREWNVAEPITQINVRVRENNSNGTILGEGLVSYSERDVDGNIRVIFNNEISSNGYLWLEYLTDGRVGWHGTENTSDPTQNESMMYTTSKLINGNMTTTVTGGALDSIQINFLQINDEFVLTSQGITYFSNELNLAALDLSYLFEDKAFYDSLQSVVTPVFSSGGERGSPFTGWGAMFDAINVSFNALRLKNINRATSVPEADKFKYIKVFVKDTRTSATNIAESGFIEVSENLNFIEEVLFPLKDSITNEFITLTDASFTGSDYFIGYIGYNDEYNAGYIGETTGTQSNYAGTSFYNLDLDSTTWGIFSGNPSVPIEHLFLTNLTVSKSLIELVEINERLEAIENNDINTPPRIILPDSFDAVVGYKQQLFFRGIIEDLNPLNAYNIKVTGTIDGKQFPRYYEFTPTISGVKTFTISLYNRNSNLITSKTCNVNISNAGTNPASAKKVLCVGDSLTAGGYWTGELQRMLAQSGGVPLGLNMSNIELIGTVGSGVNLYEGYGGKTWDWYINETLKSDVIFNVTSHDKVSADILSIYEDSNTNQWKLESITNATTLVFSRLNHNQVPPSSGTLTYVSGGVNTSAVIYNSFVSEAVINQFWNPLTDELDFQNYISENSFGTIDYVCALLTWNGMGADRALAINHTNLINDAKVFIDKLHSQYPSAKIKLMGIQLPSINGGLGQNYGDGNSNYGNYFGLARTVFGLNLAYQELANDTNYSSFVEFVNVSAQFDNLYNMPYGQTPVNSRSATVEDIGTNGVHPSTDGYLQISDAIFRNINKEFI